MKLDFILVVLIFFQCTTSVVANDKHPQIDSMLWHHYDNRFIEPDKSIASLKKLIDLSTNLQYPWGEVKGRFLLAEVFQVIGKNDSVISYSNEGIKLSEHYGLKKQTAIGYSNKARAHQNAGDFSQANIDLHKSLKLFLEIQDTLNIYYTHLDIGWLYMLTDDLDSALVHSLKFLNYAEETGDTSLLGTAYNNLGTIHKKLKNYDKAEDLYNKGLSLMNGSKESEYHNSAFYNNLGLLYKEQERYNESLLHFVDLIEISQYFQDERGVLNALINRGSVQNEMGQFQPAEESLRRAVKLAMQLGQRSNIPDINNQLAKSLIGQKKTVEVPKLLQESLQLSEEIGLIERKLQAYEILRDYYVEKGDDRKAISVMSILQVMKDSLYEVSRIRQVNELQEKYDVKLRNDRIKTLEREAEFARRKYRSLVMFYGALTVVILLIIVLLIRHYRGRKALMEAELALGQIRREMAEDALKTKTKELSIKLLQLIKKNKFLAEHRDDLKELEKISSPDMAELLRRQIHKVDQSLGDDEFWRIFTNEFKSIHGNFLEKLKVDYQPFSKAELRMIALLKMNLSSKEIANILNITGEGVKKSRQRLRKKLKIDSSQNLQEYLLNL